MGNRGTKTRTRQTVRGIYSIDPSDEEYKDIIEHARRKLETPMAAPMPCNRAFSQANFRETGVSKTGKGKTSEAKTRFSCVCVSHESTRQRRESVTKRIHEEHIAGTGQNSVVHHNLFAKHFEPREGPKVTLRKTLVHTSSNVLRDPRETESKTQFHQRVAVGQTRMRTVFFFKKKWCARIRS